jgi:hypothetical protein
MMPQAALQEARLTDVQKELKDILTKIYIIVNHVA